MGSGQLFTRIDAAVDDRVAQLTDVLKEVQVFTKAPIPIARHADLGGKWKPLGSFSLEQVCQGVIDPVVGGFESLYAFFLGHDTNRSVWKR